MKTICFFALLICFVTFIENDCAPVDEITDASSTNETFIETDSIIQVPCMDGYVLVNGKCRPAFNQCKYHNFLPMK